MKMCNDVSENNQAKILNVIFKDIDQWPQSWAGDRQDVITGSKILTELKNYLIALAEKGRSKKTIKRHAGYLWALGGEIIRDTNENGVNIEQSAKAIILQYVSLVGGPYWRHANDDNDLRQYDSVCRSLYKYLS